MNDALNNLKGIFHVKIYDNGKLVDDYTDNNVIVVNGRGLLVNLLGGNTTNKSVTKIGFGENSTAATSTDTALSGSAFVKSFAGGAVTYPTSTSVKFDWTLETTEGNGLSITEFGLLSTDVTLFARKQRSAIAKTSSIRLVGSWTIQL